MICAMVTGIESNIHTRCLILTNNGYSIGDVERFELKFLFSNALSRIYMVVFTFK